jgi:hypothetical protein
MPALQLSALYDRQQVHDLFSPETIFTPQAGTWGLHGWVPIPGRDGDYVFFVTFGQSQAEHEFDESISDDGVLTWQSQPRQGLNDSHIRKWLQHDEFRNTIHLFLRTEAGRPYAYLGRLKYLTHDPARQRPVYFQWQLLDWEQIRGRTANLVAHIEPPTPLPSRPIGLEEVEAVVSKPRNTQQARSFSQRRKPDYSEQDARNRNLGRAGEELVLQFERDRLAREGRSDLSAKVLHVAEVEGDGAGHDIRSYRADGSAFFIEVKTTRGGQETPFYLSANEIEFAQRHAGFYCLVRVFDFCPDPPAGRFFRVEGDLRAVLDLQPLNYRAVHGGK